MGRDYSSLMRLQLTSRGLASVRLHTASKLVANSVEPIFTHIIREATHNLLERFHKSV